jgi:hypothetical protein
MAKNTEKKTRFRALTIALSGFAVRSNTNVVQGTVEKCVEKDDGPFAILKLTAPCQVNRETPDGREVTVETADAGEYIGIGLCASLSALRDNLGCEFRITYRGEKPSKKYKGKFVQLYYLEQAELEE